MRTHSRLLDRGAATFSQIGLSQIALVLLGLALTAPSLAQLSGTGDRFLVVGENLMKGDPNAAFGAHRIVTGDLNCDGKDDVVVLQPDASINVGGSQIAGGGVTVVPTTATAGPQANASFEWTQQSPGVSDTTEAGDRFGHAATIFDQNGDGCADLFIGVPGEDFTSVGGDPLPNIGDLQAFFGSSSSVLTTSGQAGNTTFIFANDNFGESVVTMGFGSALTDHHVVAGVPGANSAGPINNSGNVQGFAAGNNCLLCADSFLRDMVPLVTAPQSNERFGTEMLAFGDGVGKRFLALRGDGGNRLTLIRNLATTPIFSVFTRASLSPPPNAGSSAFAEIMAAGDFDGNGSESVALLADDGNGGAAYEIFVLSRTSAGSVSFLQQQRLIGPLLPDVEFLFVASMASGDFDRDGFDDLALGFPGIDSLTSTVGTVLVLRGSPAGLITANPQRLQQGSNGLVDTAQTGDAFGSALASGDVNGDGTDDLVVGVPGEKVGTETRGGIHLILGAPQVSIFSNSFEN